MKLSKTLLAAILTGITLQTVQSCTKDKDGPTKEEKDKDEGKDKGKPNPVTAPYSCLACGNG